MEDVNKPVHMTKEEFINNVINATIDINHILSKLTAELHSYEKRYKMRSEIFYNLIVGTPMEDQPDFINWAICYRSYFRILQSRFNLKEIVKNVP